MIQVEKWQKDLAVFQNIKTTFIVEGNVHDLVPYTYEDGSCEPIPLNKYLHNYLNETGYDPIVFYNKVDGFRNPYASQMVDTFLRAVDSDNDPRKPICDATDLMRKALDDPSRATAVVFDLANTITSSPDNLSEEEMEYFTRLMLSSMNPIQGASVRDHKPLKNTLFLIVEKVNDIPAWFYLNNPQVKTLTITRPEKEVRKAVIDARLDILNGASGLSPGERRKIVEDFANLTDGMTMYEIYDGVITLAYNKRHNVKDFRETIRMFKYGETESHWDKLDKDSIRRVEEELSRRVKGQDHAIDQAASIIRRAYSGMTGMQGGSEGRPKGVMFMAGPTGTGKTELAKTIAEFVFGDESFLTRFDMSEYGAPHSDQKLLGAPPGYVGYSEGGQLTNALKRKPFSVFLFDEIEKAHPSILDKFLQILEDGRITDSAGETLYFSESLIIFTSNLGVIKEDKMTGVKTYNITPEMDYDTLHETLINEIKDYFKFDIRRPELLNRIGDNFLIFDFIHEDGAKMILDLKLDKVIDTMLQVKGIKLKLEEPFRKYLSDIAISDLSNGGRGVSNLVESRLINPLSDIIVETDWKSGDTLVIHDGPADAEGNYSIM